MPHSILITPFHATPFREKMSDIGVRQDTIHLTPGDQYTLSISSLTGAGTVVQQDNRNVGTTQRSNEIITEQF